MKTKIPKYSFLALTSVLLASCGRNENSNLAGISDYDVNLSFDERNGEQNEDSEALALKGNKKSRKDANKKKNNDNKNKADKKDGKLNQNSKKDSTKEKPQVAKGKQVGAAVAFMSQPPTAKTNALGILNDYNKRCASAAAAYNPPAAATNLPLVRTVTVRHALVCFLDLAGTKYVSQTAQVPGLSPGDQILVRAEFSYTNDVATKDAQRGSKRYKDENRYDVRVSASLGLSSSASASNGRTIVTTNRTTTPLNHHGYVVLSGETIVANGDGDKVNLITSAEVPDAPPPQNGVKRRNQNPSNAAPDDLAALFVEPKPHRTKLDVLVLRPNWQNSWTQSTLQSSAEQVKTPKVMRGMRYVVIALPLGQVKAGEVFDAEALIQVKANTPGNPGLATGHIIIADSPTSLEGQHVSVKFGENLSSGQKGTIRKVGATTASRSYTNAWMNVIVNTMSDTTSAGHLDVFSEGSSLNVRRYTPK